MFFIFSYILIYMYPIITLSQQKKKVEKYQQNRYSIVERVCMKMYTYNIYITCLKHYNYKC